MNPPTPPPATTTAPGAVPAGTSARRRLPLLLAAALLPLSACGIPATGVVEAGEPATGVLEPGRPPTPSQAESVAVPVTTVPLYFVTDGALVAVGRTTHGAADLGSAVLMLFKGPDEREREAGLTTELPPASVVPTIRTDGAAVVVQLPRSAGSLSGTAVDQLACTVAVARLRQDPALGSAQVTVEQPGGRLAGRSSDDCPAGGTREAGGTGGADGPDSAEGPYSEDGTGSAGGTGGG
ncbi:hypothetical protein [Streptomyces sp. E2N166]|uniref:hypothetical protein n=1 Tax=Streptomyces sp. E2N166 TaxID=1851909 RepID=UPI001EE83BF7|nr:hypothetical protein [Streptomyces sp. E2N166]